MQCTKPLSWLPQCCLFSRGWQHPVHKRTRRHGAAAMAAHTAVSEGVCSTASLAVCAAMAAATCRLFLHAAPALVSGQLPLNPDAVVNNLIIMHVNTVNTGNSSYFDQHIKLALCQAHWFFFRKNKKNPAARCVQAAPGGCQTRPQTSLRSRTASHPGQTHHGHPAGSSQTSSSSSSNGVTVQQGEQT